MKLMPRRLISAFGDKSVQLNDQATAALHPRESCSADVLSTSTRTCGPSQDFSIRLLHRS